VNVGISGMRKIIKWLKLKINSMKIEVSNGELLDKLTILELKIKNIKDTSKLVNVYKEFNELNPLAKELFEKNDSDLQNHYLALAEVNSKLWDIEDDIRDV